MKVFHFDPSTGKRGELIEVRGMAYSTSNPQGLRAKLPKANDQDWSVATEAADHNGQPIKYQIPVCFCLGQLTCGTDTSWHWVALLPVEKM